MADGASEDKVELYEHFFRDPRVGEGVLQPPHEGIACRNIRDALRLLGYDLPVGDRYDPDLRGAVQQFQISQAHDSRDGLVGPGTRRLLTRIVIGISEGFFKRGRMSPEYAVFLSYSRKDEGRVADIVGRLQTCGIPVFRDREAIPGGASWPEMLYRSVRKCQVFVCMLSAHAATSINVLIEVALARHAGRPILPVVLEAVDLPSALRSLVGGAQHIAVSNPVSNGEFDKLLESLSIYGVRSRPVEK
jgi:hypothetical protein